MPNEIFSDLINSDIKSVHIPFAYSYYYLINWLYRNTKYGSFNIDQKKIKEILGYNPNEKRINYIIKKDGLLDHIGYTRTDKDYPMSWEINDDLEFIMLSDFTEDVQRAMRYDANKRFTVKFPIKAFYRHMEDEEMKEDYDNDYRDGTFYEVDNTHLIPFEVFMHCMTNKDIGCAGFYLYSYLKMKNQIFEGGYDVPMKALAEDSGLSYSVMVRTLSNLRKFNLVEAIHNQKFFCLSLEDGKRKANTYVTNDFELFYDKPKQYKKMKVVSVEDYAAMKEIEEKAKRDKEQRVNIPLEELPY